MWTHLSESLKFLKEGVCRGKRMETRASHQSHEKRNTCGNLLNDEDCQKYQQLVTRFDILHEQFKDIHRQFNELHNQAMKLREAGELYSKGQGLHQKAKELHENAMNVLEQAVTGLEKTGEIRHKAQTELIRKMQDTKEKLQDS
jgi:hypothetical protein